MLNNSNSRGEFPGVSVVIAVLNEEANLAATIRSISQQDYKGEIEIILALGPSVDKTNQVATSLAKIDLRVKLIQNPSGK
ncbi:MAG: glycosyltransferase, partial [Candidatus Fonsibacter sp.]